MTWGRVPLELVSPGEVGEGGARSWHLAVPPSEVAPSSPPPRGLLTHWHHMDTSTAQRGTQGVKGLGCPWGGHSCRQPCAGCWPAPPPQSRPSCRRQAGSPVQGALGCNPPPLLQLGSLEPSPAQREGEADKTPSTPSPILPQHLWGWVPAATERSSGEIVGGVFGCWGMQHGWEGRQMEGVTASPKL